MKEEVCEVCVQSLCVREREIEISGRAWTVQHICLPWASLGCVLDYGSPLLCVITRTSDAAWQLRPGLKNTAQLTHSQSLCSRLSLHISLPPLPSLSLCLSRSLSPRVSPSPSFSIVPCSIFTLFLLGPLHPRLVLCSSCLLRMCPRDDWTGRYGADRQMWFHLILWRGKGCATSEYISLFFSQAFPSSLM